MSNSKLTPEFDQQFKAALAQKGPANEVLQGCLEVLSKHKMSYVLPEVPAKFFLTHKMNRNGLMLSPYNCHSNALKIHNGGADRKMLTNALCCELAADGEARKSQLEANEKLSSRSGGLLAPINGEERYLTLGCGHTTAFVKLALIKGMTMGT